MLNNNILVNITIQRQQIKNSNHDIVVRNEKHRKIRYINHTEILKKFISIHNKQQNQLTIRIIIYVEYDYKNLFVRQQKNNENCLHAHFSQQEFDIDKNANIKQQNYQHLQHIQFMQK